MTRPQPPWAPPLVELSIGVAGHLPAWEKNEADGAWQAWVSWVQETQRAERARWSRSAPPAAPLEPPGACRRVPRRLRGRGGQIRDGS